MTYSSGIFLNPAATLEDASIEKLDRICRKLRLRETDRLLEIGTGWGSFALHAARHYGCHVTTTTLSDAQYAYALQAVEEAGLEKKITLLQKDYRALEGRYDKLASIEMIEAVGYEYIPEFFHVCNRLLKPEGLMALQAITLSDQAFDRYRRSVDYIRRYVFPGACLISLSHVLQCLKKETDMRLLHLEDLTPHYAETLRRWRERFLSRLADVRQLGFSDPFIRLWEFYLVYCEGGFREAHIGDVQMVLARSGYRGPR
jgi:cyclopropane-fatty-acyl-phospholipid synthase